GRHPAERTREAALPGRHLACPRRRPRHERPARHPRAGLPRRRLPRTGEGHGRAAEGTARGRAAARIGSRKDLAIFRGCSIAGRSMRTGVGWLVLGLAVLGGEAISEAFYLDPGRNFDVRARAYSQLGILTEYSARQGCVPVYGTNPATGKRGGLLFNNDPRKC